MSNKKRSKVQHQARQQARNDEKRAAKERQAIASAAELQGQLVSRLDAVDAEADDEPNLTTVVTFDGIDWKIDRSAFASPELLYLLADMQAMADEELTEDDAAEAMVAMMRVIRKIFGREQGRRFSMRCPDPDSVVNQLRAFFETASPKVGSPDPSSGSASSDSTSESSRPTSEPTSV